MCIRDSIQSGIKTVIYDSDKYDKTPAVMASKMMFQAAGVQFKKYMPTNRKIEITV